MTWTITPEPVDSPDAVALWRSYYTEVSDRWYLLHQGRTTDPAELEREITANTGKDLSLLLLARHNGTPAGTAGIRRTPDPTTTELTRVFLLPHLRGKGGATHLVTAAEQAARTLGATRMILDTRSDLVEARALYARLGYEETQPHNTDPYAEHWFSKRLT
ncbi:N-acetyltransferase [Streptomyces spinoverrucosus]|uniref:N-acetyltransferase n=1 Tax=Streptomyces spinoverrucosus TaxID=284043 RepID=A0A4Y3VPL9_9ACTN|nr:GNAT family N-acetyltransferase [Streptomyces spinoverrucosus]GEC08972.1 N-acetyltransferase [Streptomyces spinoverrucosus]GHB66001.1 N-acetyltransferase [Streptomyces spinoverrucosus]